MTDEELIERLRDACRGGDGCKCSLSEAADRIEALVKYRDAYAEMERTANDALRKYETRVERLEEALLWCSGSADFNEGGVAREGWLKVCAPLLTGGKDE